MGVGISRMDLLSDDIREQEKILHGMIERITDQKFRDLAIANEVARLTCRLNNLKCFYSELQEADEYIRILMEGK